MNGNNPDKTITEKLAAFVANFSLKDMDAQSVKDARLAVLDSIGCGIAGSMDPAVDTLSHVLIQAGEQGSCPVFARGTCFNPKAAALINGTMVHALEMDDTHSFSSVHAGGPVVASALCTCFDLETNGERFLEGIISGYEIACRLGTAIRGKSPYHRGFHPTGICGVFGAATACGKIIGLDVKGILNAWGIAASMSGGLMAYLQNGAWTKKLHSGWAAQSGFMAALLARSGYLGPNDIFSGQYNFCDAYSDAFNGDVLLQDLGSHFEISRMSYKRFACCRTIHGPITAALMLRSGHDFRPEKIEQIHALIPDEDIDLVIEPLTRKIRPESIIEAQFSMPFGVALALVEGDAMPDQYTRDSMKNPTIRKLSEKFSYVVKDEFTRRRPLHFPCELWIKLNGEWLSARVDAPFGDYTNPLSSEQLREKFRLLSEPVIGEQRMRALEEFIMNMETERRIAKITELFTATD